VVGVKQNQRFGFLPRCPPLGLTNLAPFLLNLLNDGIPLKHSYSTFPVFFLTADAGNKGCNRIF